MKFPKIVKSGVLLAGCLCVAMALAADKAKTAKPAAPPDEKAAMELMAKAATPGEGHQKLEPLAGNFDVKVKAWMDPKKPPEESTATATRKWILGNRFLQEDYTGTFMGQPFNGLGFQGYDNVTKRYVGTWMDTMGTGLMTSEGKLDGKALKLTGMAPDPMAGKNESYRMTITLVDKDHHTIEMWGKGPDGKPMKWMELAYTRKP
ncbi:DUF1579 domain-containing protein [Burkholderiaceae bacterium UC74_6]